MISDQRPITTLSVACPACRQDVAVEVRVASIETAGLTLVGMNLQAQVNAHPCPGYTDREAPQ